MMKTALFRYCIPRVTGLALVLLTVQALGAETEAAPDRIFLNARIWTGDSARPESSALAIRADRVVAVGSDEEIRSLAGTGTRVENLGGRRMLPGFQDAHWHLPTRRSADLADARDTDEIVHDADGVPTGLLKESAMSLVSRLLPPVTADEVYAALRAEMREAARLGITALQLANSLDELETAVFERALQEDNFLVRFRVAIPFSADVTDADLAGYIELRDRHTGPLLRYGIAKGMLDGTVDVGTAAMLEPFAQGGGTGMVFWEQTALNDQVVRFDRAGLQVQLHAIGDRAIRMALDAFEHAANVNGPRDRRHRVEHLEVPAPSDLPRFAKLGVIASGQPIFATPDVTTLTSYAPMLGPERAARANNFRALEDAGAVQAFGSDYAVFPMDPLLGIYTVVTLQLPDGTPPGGYFPENRISLPAALRHYTWGSAYASFREHELGVLAPGMLADLVVLSEDIINAPPQALLRARVLLTVMGGRDTHRDPDWSGP
jgi:predicted amidohydrolase YtcJ